MATKKRTAETGLDSRNRYAILHRVATAKRQATREKRIARFAQLCAEGKTLH